jgi:hypothetical protein
VVAATRTYESRRRELQCAVKMRKFSLKKRENLGDQIIELKENNINK